MRIPQNSIIISAREIFFSRRSFFVCLFVCLSVFFPVCLLKTSRKTADQNFTKILTRDVPVDKEKIIKF